MGSFNDAENIVINVNVKEKGKQIVLFTIKVMTTSKTSSEKSYLKERYKIVVCGFNLPFFFFPFFIFAFFPFIFFFEYHVLFSPHDKPDKLSYSRWGFKRLDSSTDVKTT
jgi:hypothetical protein